MPRKISAKKIKDLCNIALDDLKAVDINAFDVEKTSSFASYILLATGTSNRHVKSLAEKVVDDLKDNKVQILGIEGTESHEIPCLLFLVSEPCCPLNHRLLSPLVI